MEIDKIATFRSPFASCSPFRRTRRPSYNTHPELRGYVLHLLHSGYFPWIGNETSSLIDYS